MASDEALTLLRSIDATLKALLALSQRRTAAKTESGATVASDHDLDGKYGNPVVKAKDPRDWNGPTMKGRKYSECPAEYLDLLASRLDWFAQKADEEGKRASNGKPESHYLKLDASRARGWAARVRAGKTPTPQGAPAEEPGWETDDAGWSEEA